jgi:hypothetical protein
MTLDLAIPCFNEASKPIKPPRGWPRNKARQDLEKQVYDAIGKRKVSNADLMAATGLSQSAVGFYLHRLLIETKPKRIHVAGFFRSTTRGRRKLLYAQGNKPNLVEPPIRIRPAIEQAKIPVEPQQWFSALFAPPIAF